MKELIEQIEKLKKEKDAVILVHNYQLPEIQDIADVLGDSLDLSRQARETANKLIVFCGVRFMAETAKILSPDKTVLLPVWDAGCPMADMITREDLIRFKKENPDYKIVSYVNTTAEVKAETDICVTSANAVKVVKNYPYNKLLFTPDRNLGNYVKQQVPEKEIKIWDGCCNIHVRFKISDIKKAREIHPDAVLLVHPECNPEVVAAADHVCSTNQMITLIKESAEKTFLIATESGIIYRMQKECPGKTIYPAGKEQLCPNMKKTRIQDVLKALQYTQYEITLSADIIEKAKNSLTQMLLYS